MWRRSDHTTLDRKISSLQFQPKSPLNRISWFGLLFMHFLKFQFYCSWCQPLAASKRKVTVEFIDANVLCSSDISHIKRSIADHLRKLATESWMEKYSSEIKAAAVAELSISRGVCRILNYFNIKASDVFVFVCLVSAPQSLQILNAKVEQSRAWAVTGLGLFRILERNKLTIKIAHTL